MLIIASGSQLTIEKRKVNANMCARQNQETQWNFYACLFLC